MKKFHILNANGITNPNVENLFLNIFKDLNIIPVFHNEFKVTYVDDLPIPMHLDLIYFDGGEDVDPSLYHQNKHTKTYTNKSRDSQEKSNFHKVKQFYPNIPCFGICRG